MVLAFMAFGLAFAALLAVILGFSGPWLIAYLVCGVAFGGFFGTLAS